MTSSLLAAAAEGGAPEWLAQIAGLVIGAAVIAYFAFRIGIVPIIGFVLAGVLIGPSQFGIVSDRELVDAAAEVGVILLLFTIGLEFSLERLLRIRRVIFVAGGLQVALTTLLATGVLTAAGVATETAIYTGLLVSLSSTALVLKLLADRAETNARHGQLALGILLFQDLAVVLMVLLVPALGGDMGSPLDFAWALAKAALIIAGVLFIARRLMPKLLEVVARTCSPEVFLLTVVAVCFGTAYGTSFAGVSVSLGAFLAGLLVSESRFDQQALGEILPLQIVFSAVFFVSVGMLLDVGFLLGNLPAVLGAIVAVLVLKVVTTGLAVRALGERGAVIGVSAFLLAQVGEFSFVLERAGAEAGLSPAGLGADGTQGFLAASVLLLVATPWLAGVGARVGGRMPEQAPARAERGTEPDEGSGVAEGLDDHVVVCGYGKVARVLTAALTRGGVPTVVTTLSPDGAAEAQRRGLRVLLGDASRTRTLQEAGVTRARFVVIADDEPAMATRVAGVAHALNARAKIVVRTRYEADMAEPHEAGATYVISDEAEGMAHLSEKLLTHYDVAGETIETTLYALRVPSGRVPQDGRPDPFGGGTVVDTERLVEADLDPEGCPHVAETRAVLPSASGCEDCLREGSRWVHLRVCMTCGHVGCCDSSPNRHARRHWESTDHPVMRSGEPGENWGYCFADERTLEPARDEVRPVR